MKRRLLSAQRMQHRCLGTRKTTYWLLRTEGQVSDLSQQPCQYRDCSETYGSNLALGSVAGVQLGGNGHADCVDLHEPHHNEDVVIAMVSSHLQLLSTSRHSRSTMCKVCFLRRLEQCPMVQYADNPYWHWQHAACCWEVEQTLQPYTDWCSQHSGPATQSTQCPHRNIDHLILYTALGTGGSGCSDSGATSAASCGAPGLVASASNASFAFSAHTSDDWYVVTFGGRCAAAAFATRCCSALRPLPPGAA